MLNPFKVKQQTKASQPQDKPMELGPKPIQSTLATTVPARVPVVQNLVKGSLGGLFVDNLFGLFAQVESAQLCSSNGIRTDVRIQIGLGRFVLATVLDTVSIKVANL
jgi:hypothetical protein